MRRAEDGIILFRVGSILVQPTFIVTEGAERGQVFELVNLVSTIGRDATCELRLSDMRVSRHHAEVSRSDHSCEITDLDSSNGTWVNGAQVKRKALASGDIVQVGSTQLRFQLKKDSPSAVERLSHGETQRITLGTEGLFLNWPDASDLDSLRRAKTDLETLYRLGRTLNPIMETGQLVPKIMDTIFEEVRKVDRCTILITDPESGRVTGSASRFGRSVAPTAELPYSKTMLDQVLKEKKAVLTFDAMSDDRFRAGQSVQTSGIRSAICAPLQYQKTILGVIQADTIVPEHRFTRDDLRLIAAIGLQAGAALANAQLYERLVYEKAELHVANQKLKSAQDKLIQSEKLAAVGQLASGIVHDLKNPITVILGYLSIMRDKLENQARDTFNALKLDDDLKAAEKGIQFCNDVISELLKFSRPSELTKAPLDVNELITATLKFLHVELLKAQAKTELHLAAGLPRLLADGNQLKQVFINIILNAIQAFDKPVRIIRVTSEVIGAEKHAQVRISFTDNGKGMTEDQRRRVFDPFFTTKSAGSGLGGTGLGMSVSYSIIDGHGGSIEVRSIPGEGSTFSVLLPVTAKP